MKTTAAAHPAGLTACATTVLIFIAEQAGLNLSAEVAAAFVGLITGVVSYFTPR